MDPEEAFDKWYGENILAISSGTREDAKIVWMAACKWQGQAIAKAVAVSHVELEHTLAEYVRVGEAARILRCSREWMRRLAERGRVRSNASPFGLLILREELEAAAAKRAEETSRAR